MSFNLDLSKQIQEVIFTRNQKNNINPSLLFNNSNISQTTFQNYLGIILGARLTFKEHFNMTLSKINKSVRDFRVSYETFLPRTFYLNFLLSIYKAFVWPRLYYDDAVYDEVYSAYFHQKLESTQYNASSAMTVAIKGSSKEKLYQWFGSPSIPSPK